MEKSYYKSPIGILEIICDNGKLVSLKLVDYCEKSNVETDFIKDIKKQLDEYFSGKRTTFDIKLILQELIFKKWYGKNFKIFLMAKQKVIQKLLRQQEIKMHKEQLAMPAIKI